MFYTKIFLVAILFKCILIRNAKASDIADLKQKYADIIMNCARSFPISAKDIRMLKQQKMPDNANSKCLFACAYKKTGMMDNKGMLSVEGVHKLAQANFAGDSEQMKRTIQFTDACKYVNYEPVFDGDQGCDRAALIFKCSIEKASQFNIPV